MPGSRRTNQPRRWAAIALVLSAASCRQGEERAYYGTTAPRHGPDELWINNSTEPEWIDPGRMSDGAGAEIAFNVFAGLAQYHPTTLEPVPDLARRWTMLDDGRRWVFELRDAVWSDGKPLTAHDVVWSWKRVLDPKTSSKTATMLYVLANGAAFNQRALRLRGPAVGTSTAVIAELFGRQTVIDRVEKVDGGDGWYVYPAGDPTQAEQARTRLVGFFGGREELGATLSLAVSDGADVGVRAIDDKTLEVRLRSSIPYFLHLMPFYTFYPVPRHAIEKLAAAGKNPDLWTRPEHLVASGPYLMTEWKFRQHMRFEKNPRYWDADRVRTPKITVFMVESYNTTLNLYRAGELDWVGRNASLPAEFMEHLSTFRDFRRSPMLSVYFYWINTTVPPLDDPRVRRALSLAIDRQAIVDYVTRAGQIPTADLVPDGLAGYQARNTPIFDPEKARALLAETPYGNGRPFPHPVVLSYNTSEAHKQIAEAVQQMWKKHLGLTIEIENLEWNIFLKNMQLKNYHLARFGWNGDYPDPYTFLELFTTHNGNNASGWARPEYDALLDRANLTADPALRLSLFREAEELAMNDTPLIPLYVYTRSQLVKPYVRGWWPNYFDRHPWKYMWIDPRWSEGVPAVPGEDPPPDRAWFERD